MAAMSRHRPQNPLFDQALRNHLESLRTEDREAFEHCVAGDVIAAVHQLNSSHSAQSRTRRFLVRFAAVVSPLESYFDLVSNVVDSIPGAQLGAIVFGALRFVVKAVNGLSDYFERIVGILEEISQSLPYYQDYAVDIYRDSVPVQQALADVYHDIILVCSAVRDVFLKRGGAARSGVSVWLRGINPWNKTIEDITAGSAAVVERSSSAKSCTQTVSVSIGRLSRESGMISVEIFSLCFPMRIVNPSIGIVSVFFLRTTAQGNG
ncbi:hypothetical protein EDB89DRAFT_1002872 [Lactarius sanguifluus]|nr:hypothetical protein EDB89DRAFT_1002872 [Lactarius sanguifluus]